MAATGDIGTEKYKHIQSYRGHEIYLLEDDSYAVSRITMSGSPNFGYMRFNSVWSAICQIDEELSS